MKASFSEHHIPKSSVRSHNSSGIFDLDSPLYRRKAWLEISGAMYEMCYNSLYYYRLLKENKTIQSRFADQIYIDLHRTFPKDPFFSDPKSFEILDNILTAYSFRNPNVGYCQGMNFIAGRFLTLGFSEVETFWMLVQVVERYLPFEYYSTMSGVLIDQKVFDYLLRTRLPKIAKVFDKLEINSSLITVQWFTCLFAYTFRANIVTRIWDEVFKQGHGIIYRISLAVFFLAGKELKGKKELTEVFQCFENTCKSIKNPEKFLQLIDRKLFRIHPVLLERIKDSATTEANKELLERCNTIYTKEEIMKKMLIICDDDDTCKQIDYATTSFFTFMTDLIISIDDDYLELELYRKVVDVSLIRESQDLMVGRKNHLCRKEPDYNEVKSFKNDVKSSFLEITQDVRDLGF